MSCDCKTCKRYKGNCGYHYVDQETHHIDYEIPAEAVCDKTGVCSMYEAYISPEERALNELKNSGISAESKVIILRALNTEVYRHGMKIKDWRLIPR